MNTVTRRGFSILLVLALCISLLSGLTLSVSAATVDYTYNGKYIYNWGQRGTTATFLSPNAEAFYKTQGTSYEALSALSGASNTSSTPSSELYLALQELMTDAQTYRTSYDDTKNLYMYTDCQNGGGKISSFYSGVEIGPSWDGTWNREHTWPNSKGDASGNGENDIMMLRPTSSSENSSRGNKAYGKSSTYYNPNGESNGTYDLRGDVSRIMLYVYTRWGNTGSMWGSDGVIESKAVLLEWMEEDPVDTWELGRNDAVEAITGTRNVYVDYPELAFLLFDTEIPDNYSSPSGEGSVSNYTITAVSNNNLYGTVSVSGNNINAFPANGYYAAGYTILNGSATVGQNNNAFTVTASSDCTVQINFAPRTGVTVSFSENGTVTSKSVYTGDSVTLPDAAVSIDGFTFQGWVTAPLSETGDRPDNILPAGDTYAVTNTQTLYALYSRVDANGTGSNAVFAPYTGNLVEGDYILTYKTATDLGALKAAVSNSRLSYTVVSLTDSNIQNPDASIIWHIAPSENDYTIYNAATESYAAGTSTNNKAALLNSVTDYARWTVIAQNGTYDFINRGNSRYLRRNEAFGFACYSDSTGGALTLYMGIGGTVYYTTSATNCQHTWGEWLEITAPGCETAGEEARECTICGTVVSQPIAATGHSWGEWIIEAATCTVAGGKLRECSICKILDEEVIAATGHSYTAVVTSPTVTEQGYTTHTCANCGDSYTDTYVEALGPTYTVSFAVPSGVPAIPSMDCGKAGITLPKADAPEEKYTFAGWVTAPLAETTDTPAAALAANSNYIASADTTLYALYTYAVAGENTGSGDYIKVTGAPNDWSGEYVIVYEANSMIFNGSLEKMDAANNYKAVTISNSTISAAQGDAYKFTVAAANGGYSIQAASGNYIGRSADSNGLDAGSTALKNTISLNADGTVNIVGAGGAYLRYNATSNQMRFRYYKSETYTNQKAIALYKKDGAGTTTYYTTIAGESAEIIESANVTLNSVLGVNFTIHAPDDSTVAFTVGGTAVEAAIDGSVYTVSVMAQDMMKNIVATVYGAEGEILDTQLFTLVQYVADINSMDVLDETKALANATLAYCQNAAKVKGNYSGEMAELAAIPEDAFESHKVAYTCNVPGALKGASIYCYLDEACELRLRLSTNGYTVKVGETVLEAQASGDTFVYGTGKLLAQEYSTEYTFTVMNGEKQVLSVNASVLAYLGAMIERNGVDEDMKNLLISMYHYYAAAAAYEAANP